MRESILHQLHLSTHKPKSSEQQSGIRLPAGFQADAKKHLDSHVCLCKPSRCPLKFPCILCKMRGRKKPPRILCRPGVANAQNSQNVIVLLFVIDNEMAFSLQLRGSAWRTAAGLTLSSGAACNAGFAKLPNNPCFFLSIAFLTHFATSSS